MKKKLQYFTHHLKLLTVLQISQKTLELQLSSTVRKPGLECQPRHPESSVVLGNSVFLNLCLLTFQVDLPQNHKDLLWIKSD